MAISLKFYNRTEAEILALTPLSTDWSDLAFYYPYDKDYFYRIVENEMRLYGGGNSVLTGIGITLNNKTVGVVKSLIEENEILNIPQHWEYNANYLTVDGVINCEGLINLL